MILSIDDRRADALIERISIMSRKYDSIRERFSYLSQNINMELQGEESIRSALRDLENEMNRIHTQIKKMKIVLEEILSEYHGVYRQCRQDVDELKSDLDAVAIKSERGTQKYKHYSPRGENAAFQAYIQQINTEITEPVGFTRLFMPELHIEVEQIDIEGNIQVLAWKKPEFL
ncbi:MAG: DUF4600 domain-containing protein [Fibrobacter sp.]|nr:DUF4600 domain-containing protein [Fibrobacter sp.]